MSINDAFGPGPNYLPPTPMPASYGEQMIATAINGLQQMGHQQSLMLDRALSQLVAAEQATGGTLCRILEMQQKIVDDVLLQVSMLTIRANHWEREARRLAGECQLAVEEPKS